MANNRPPPKTYICNLCLFQFKDESGLRKHKKRKNKCISEDHPFVQKKLEEHKEEIERLRAQNEQVQAEKDKAVEHANKLLNMNDKITGMDRTVNVIKEMVIENNLAAAVAAPTYNLTQNNNNDNKSLNFNIQLAPKEKERLDHIPTAQMLHILNQKDFARSVADLVQAVSFNPKAPENMTWCINDKKSENGALEYNSELNIITRDDSSDVITRNLQSILFPVTDILKEIVIVTKAKINKQQNRNYTLYFNLLGATDIKKEYINIIKERAFDKRGLCKALWEHLQIGLETKKINFKSIIFD